MATMITAYVDTFGNLCNLASGEIIRAASTAEAEASAVAAESDGGVGAIEAPIRHQVTFEQWWDGVLGSKGPARIVREFELVEDGLSEWLGNTEAEAERLGVNTNCEGAFERALELIRAAIADANVSAAVEELNRVGEQDLAAMVANYELLSSVMADVDTWGDVDEADQETVRKVIRKITE